MEEGLEEGSRGVAVSERRDGMAQHKSSCAMSSLKVHVIGEFRSEKHYQVANGATGLQTKRGGGQGACDVSSSNRFIKLS